MWEKSSSEQWTQTTELPIEKGREPSLHTPHHTKSRVTLSCGSLLSKSKLFSLSDSYIRSDSNLLSITHIRDCMSPPNRNTNNRIMPCFAFKFHILHRISNISFLLGEWKPYLNSTKSSFSQYWELVIQKYLIEFAIRKATFCFSFAIH